MSRAKKSMYRKLIWPLLLLHMLPSCVNTPDDHRVVAFRDDCATTLSDLQATKVKLQSAGWLVVGADAHPELSSVMSLAESLDAELMEVSSFSYYQKLIGSNEVFLVLTHVPIQGEFANGCYLYDFDETESDVSKVVERWLGEPPTETLFQPNLIQQRQWVSPKSQPKMATIRVALIFEGGSLAEEVGFSGAVWAATAFAD